MKLMQDFSTFFRIMKVRCGILFVHPLGCPISYLLAEHGYVWRSVDAEADDATFDFHNLDGNIEGRQNNPLVGLAGEYEHGRVSFQSGMRAKPVLGNACRRADFSSMRGRARNVEVHVRPGKRDMGPTYSALKPAVGE
jgi:hypothetical protein